MMMTQESLFYKNAKGVENILKKLANANRLMILCSLLSDEKSTEDLMTITGLSQSALSQHLSKLKMDNIIRTRKSGRNIYYKICDIQIISLISTLHLIYCKD